MNKIEIEKAKSADIHYLYHYFERSFGPFRSLTDLPMEEAHAWSDIVLNKYRAEWIAQKGADKK